MKNSGFTLIEMLVVITVLVLLMGIAMPAIISAVAYVHTSQSQSIINQLDQAVKLYQMDFSTAPNTPGGDPNGLPVSNYNDGANTWYGCQSIVLALTGYYYQDSSGRISYGANPSNGYGWKTGRNSQTLGPYNDSDKINVTPGGNSGYTTATKTIVPPSSVIPVVAGAGNQTNTYTLINDVYPGAIADCGAKISHHVFLDAFGQAILYYSTNNATHTYAYRPSGDLADNFCADGFHDHDVFGNAYPGGVYYAREDVYWEQQVHPDPGQSGTQSGVYTT